MIELKGSLFSLDMTH